MCVSRNDNRPSVFCDAYTTEKTADDGKTADEFSRRKFLFDESCFSAPASAYFKPMDTFTWDYNSGACCLDPPESRSRFGKNRKCMGNISGNLPPVMSAANGSCTGWGKRIFKRIQWMVAYLGKAFLKHPLQWLLVLGVMCVAAWFYGVGKLEVYGYTASDTPVHLYWINGMEENNIFIDGVYPFGYHCIIYYLHAVFQIDSYVLMCLFSLAQTIAIHLVLLAFLRLCCKSRYVSYAVVLVYILGNFLQPSTYLTVFCRSSTGIWDAFYSAVSIFCLSLFCGKKTGNTGKKDKIIVGMVSDIFCHEFWHDTCCPFL